MTTFAAINQFGYGVKREKQSQNASKGNPYVGFLWVILIVLLLNGLIFQI